MDNHILESLLLSPPGRAVINALRRFIDADHYLLRVDANERSLTHRIAMYLQAELPDWDVDCEYNRDGHEPKELTLKGDEPDSWDTDAKTVYPDVIAHRRGTQNNYLVIEFKKASREGSDNDLIKLRAFKEQFGYQYALFVSLDTRPTRVGVAHVEWVTDGEHRR